MEGQVPGKLKKQGEIVGGLKKFDVMPKKKHDWQINQINDHKIPKLKI